MNEIRIHNVWKHFRWHEDRPRNLKEIVLRLPKRRESKSGKEFWALRDVSLNVAPGETVGLIGNNGAGKSTLLKLVSGLMTPTRGRVIVPGRISAMMELGVGFHPDFTGRENVYTSGIISGLTRREIHQAFSRIVEFAELEQFIDRPVRTYSSGMYMRLAFSTAIHVDPQILLIDEVLTVGDQSFQRKCIDRLYRIKSEGKTILLVSHDLAMVRSFCERACWLEKGRVRLSGDVEEVVSAYLSEAESGDRSLSSLVGTGGEGSVTGVNRWGSLELEIETVTLRDGSGARRNLFEAGRGMEIEIGFRRRSGVREAIFQVAFFREDGVKCFDANTWADGAQMENLDDGGHIVLSIDRLDLSEGSYTMEVGVYSRDWSQIYDYYGQVCSFDVFSSSRHQWVRR